MYQNIGQGNALGLGNVGGFADNLYWSSTEFDGWYAWSQFFHSGSQSNANKFDARFSVRAVRAF
jgi:hypothetical protein|tara:strand:- start:24 stop:215 length:192 start_codon:yes stop_codon:yes gene_type:complete